MASVPPPRAPRMGNLAKDPACCQRELKMKSEEYPMTNIRIRAVVAALGLLLTFSGARAQTPPPAPQTSAPDFQAVIARQGSLVTEFDANGLKVLVKRREGSQTVAVQLYIQGGAGNITAAKAGGEAFLPYGPSGPSTAFPGERNRK